MSISLVKTPNQDYLLIKTRLNNESQVARKCRITPDLGFYENEREDNELKNLYTSLGLIKKGFATISRTIDQIESKLSPSGYSSMIGNSEIKREIEYKMLENVKPLIETYKELIPKVNNGEISKKEYGAELKTANDLVNLTLKEIETKAKTRYLKTIYNDFKDYAKNVYEYLSNEDRLEEYNKIKQEINEYNNNKKELNEKYESSGLENKLKESNEAKATSELMNALKIKDKESWLYKHKKGILTTLLGLFISSQVVSTAKALCEDQTLKTISYSEIDTDSDGDIDEIRVYKGTVTDKGCSNEYSDYDFEDNPYYVIKCSDSDSIIDGNDHFEVDWDNDGITDASIQIITEGGESFLKTNNLGGNGKEVYIQDLGMENYLTKNLVKYLHPESEMNADGYYMDHLGTNGSEEGASIDTKMVNNEVVQVFIQRDSMHQLTAYPTLDKIKIIQAEKAEQTRTGWTIAGIIGGTILLSCIGCGIYNNRN